MLVRKSNALCGAYWDSFLSAEISAPSRARLDRNNISYEASKDTIVSEINKLAKAELKRLNFKPKKIRSVLGSETEEELEPQNIRISPSPSLAQLTQDLVSQSPSINNSLNLDNLPDIDDIFNVILMFLFYTRGEQLIEKIDWTHSKEFN